MLKGGQNPWGGPTCIMRFSGESHTLSWQSTSERLLYCITPSLDLEACFSPFIFQTFSHPPSALITPLCITRKVPRGN